MNKIRKRVAKWIRELELTKREKWCVGSCVLVISIIAMVLQNWDNRPFNGILQKSTYGSGSRQEVMEVDSEEISKLTGEKRLEIEIPVEEEVYTDEELKKAWTECVDQIDGELLGKNDTLDCIYYDLNLVEQVKGSGIQIEWSWDPYQVMNMEGEIQQDYVTEAGTMMRLTAVLSYEEKQIQYIWNMCVYPKPLEALESLESEIYNAVEAVQSEAQTEGEFVLPMEIGGVELTWYRAMSYRGYYVFVLGFGSILYYLYQKIENKKRQMIQRKEQMVRDYPVVIQTFALYLGAGMTIGNAWKRLALEEKESRYVYEEIKRAYYERLNGVPEAECYEGFAKRCGIRCYQRLGLLLSQNLRKGTKGLTELLEREAAEAYAERKSRAREEGEKTGTKLLIPMFLMLAVVLCIIIVPAFLTIQV